MTPKLWLSMKCYCSFCKDSSSLYGQPCWSTPNRPALHVPTYSSPAPSQLPVPLPLLRGGSCPSLVLLLTAHRPKAIPTCSCKVDSSIALLGAKSPAFYHFSSSVWWHNAPVHTFWCQCLSPSGPMPILVSSSMVGKNSRLSSCSKNRTNTFSIQSKCNITSRHK